MDRLVQLQEASGLTDEWVHHGQVHRRRCFDSTILLERHLCGRLRIFQPTLPLASRWIDRARELPEVLQEHLSRRLIQPQRLHRLVTEDVSSFVFQAGGKIYFDTSLNRRRGEPEVIRGFNLLAKALVWDVQSKE